MKNHLMRVVSTLKSFITKHPVNNQQNKVYLYLYLIATLLVVFIIHRYDYRQYELQWQTIMDGQNPWSHDSNAYGPLHSLFAPLHAFYGALPRLIFSLSILAAFFYVDRMVVKDRHLDTKQKKTLRRLLLFCPLIWIFVVIYGCNDGLVAALFFFGIVLYDQKRYIPSALLLSLAILYKYYPLFILPVLAIPNRKLNLSFSTSVTAFLAAGFGLNYLLYGATFLFPLQFSVDRESKIFSIFRYFRGDFSFLQYWDIQSIDHLSSYIVIFSVLLLFTLHLTLRWHYLKSLVLTMICVLVFNNVSHYQFYLSFYLLLTYYLLKTWGSQKLYKAVRLFLYWMSGATLLYAATEGFYREFTLIREFISLPHLVVMGVVFYEVVREN